MSNPRFGAIEAGGTKFICAVGSSPDDLGEPVRIPTTSPAETIANVIALFRENVRTHGALDGIGIASFGPAGVHLGRSDWGTILSTPKPGWSNTHLARPFGDEFGIPVGFDTDVNGAALAEYRWGAAVNAGVATYVTIGTGIGAGTVVNGRAIHGMRHPEASHFHPPRHPLDREFTGTCPFHGDCLEGLASGPAIELRWGASLSRLPADHVAHEVIAFYLGHFVTTLQAVLSPRRIVFGGGVLGTPGLLARVRTAAAQLGGGYFCGTDSLDELVVAPGLGQRSGLLGAVLLAQMAWQKRTMQSGDRR